MNVACIGYFARKSHGFSLLSHLIIPVLGIAAFIPAWLAGAGIKAPGLSFITPLSAPFSYMGPAVGDLDGHRRHLPGVPVRASSSAHRRRRR